MERGSDKATLRVPSRYALIQGSAARACLLAGPASPWPREQPRGPWRWPERASALFRPCCSALGGRKPGDLRAEPTGAGSTSPRLPRGLLDQFTEPRASRRPHPLPPRTAPPAGLPQRPARKLQPRVPSGVPLPSAPVPPPPVRPADTPRPGGANNLSAPPSRLLPQASFLDASSGEAPVHAFLPETGKSSTSVHLRVDTLTRIRSHLTTHTIYA